MSETKNPQADFNAADMERLTGLIEGAVDGFVEDGKTLGEILGVSSKEEEALYTLGHQKYSNAEYDDAVQVFSLLCRISPYETRNFNALGATLQLQKRYQEAVSCYAITLAVDITNAEASLHSGECLLLMNKTLEAAGALRGCILQCALPENKGKSEETKKIARSLLDKITETSTEQPQPEQNLSDKEEKT